MADIVLELGVWLAKGLLVHLGEAAIIEYARLVFALMAVAGVVGWCCLLM